MAPRRVRVALRTHTVWATACAWREWSSAEGHVLIDRGKQPPAQAPVAMVSHERYISDIHGLALLTLIPIDNPAGGKGIVPCDSSTFSCQYNGCLQSNFTLPQGHIVLRNGQKLAEASASTVSNLPAAASPSKQGPIPTESASCPKHASPGESGRKFAAIGAGIGVPLSIVLIVAATLFFRQRRKSHALAKEVCNLAAQVDYYKKEMDMQKVWTTNQNGGIHEVSATSDPVELLSESVRRWESKSWISSSWTFLFAVKAIAKSDILLYRNFSRIRQNRPRHRSHAVQRQKRASELIDLTSYRAGIVSLH